MHGLDTHTWKQPREKLRTPQLRIGPTLRTRTGYAHMETGLKAVFPCVRIKSVCVAYA